MSWGTVLRCCNLSNKSDFLFSLCCSLLTAAFFTFRIFTIILDTLTKNPNHNTAFPPKPHTIKKKIRHFFILKFYCCVQLRNSIVTPRGVIFQVWDNYFFWFALFKSGLIFSKRLPSVFCKELSYSSRTSRLSLVAFNWEFQSKGALSWCCSRWI